MNRQLISITAFLFIFLLTINSVYAGVGDTTVVQTLRFDTTMRAGVFLFPNDTTKTYEKIIMLYSMRCKNGLVSNSNFPNQGCGEWDYNCYTYVTDSSQTDSLLSQHSDYTIGNFSDTIFNYTTTPVWSYIQYVQQEITYTTIISEDSATIGTGTTSLIQPFAASNSVSRTQNLWTAGELTSAGLTAGDITGLRLDVQSLGSSIDNLRIRIKHTSQNVLDANSPETDGFTETYFLNTSLTNTGMHSFNFHTPFTWDGTSNIIVEFCYTNASPGTDNEVQGHDAGFNATLVSIQPDSYLNGDGSLSFIKINPASFSSITDQVTAAFWVYGDSLNLPANTSILEGNDNNNNRQLNIHLPWSDSNIYWDCGGDASGGNDRISKAATDQEIKGQWNFWAFTKNATTGIMNIYLNGALWHTGTGKTKMIDIESMVAGMGISGSNIYPGNYDELSIWNKDLSLTSIQEIMFNDITASHPDYANLLAYYKLNENAGNTAFDSSPNLFDSELINPSWRTHRGNTLFRNFSTGTFRPNTTFVKGLYTTNVQSYPVLDSVLNNATSVISYNVINNDLNVIDTIYVWQAGYSYIYDEFGNTIDSIPVAAQNTLNITQLTYFQKRAMRMELINFITPYGLGLNMNGLIGKTWQFDVTDYAPFLKGARFLAMEDGKYQEDNDIKFVFYEGTPPRNVLAVSQVWPSGTWVSPSYNDIYNDKYFEPRDINLSANGAGFKVRSAISGHGQQGEFIPRLHTITLDNSVNYTRQVWKECATNPIYPQGGTWVYDRAGWCPGAVVDVAEFELTSNVTPGTTVNLDYSLPFNANPGSSNYRVNNQLVTYGPANFVLDAAVNYIKTPSQRTEYFRLNPICNSPVISIKNTGSTTLTSLDIIYGRVGGTMSTYQWTGTLDFLETAEVTLPAPAWLTSITNTFIAIVSNPNAGTDQYAGNDTLYSDFNIPVTYPSGLVFELKTNNLGGQTSYTLKDAAGNTIINRTGLGNNIIYLDTVNLNNECYTVHLNDGGDDGLSWWANTAQGTGYFRIKNAGSGSVLKTFNSDFGDNIYQQFTVNYSLPVNEVTADAIENLKVYPNPAGDIFTAEFSLPLQATAKIKLINVLGKELLSETIVVSETVEKIRMDITTIETGIYFVVVETGNQQKMQKLVIAR
ncbi:MAG TPA: peptide-N-glycosidase F-related protein [Bacteroidia bacterium]|nr:peptide-N-glycosidase F-related protein [Bacteroidia bacterium]